MLKRPLCDTYEQQVGTFNNAHYPCCCMRHSFWSARVLNCSLRQMQKHKQRHRRSLTRKVRKFQTVALHLYHGHTSSSVHMHHVHIRNHEQRRVYTRDKYILFCMYVVCILVWGNFCPCRCLPENSKQCNFDLCMCKITMHLVSGVSRGYESSGHGVQRLFPITGSMPSL